MEKTSIQPSEILNPHNFRVETILSPNRSRRRKVAQVLLVHATVSSTIAGTIAWFQNPESDVSSDFVISKSGRIVRMVPKGDKSWHAGVCTFDGEEHSDYNDLSYGIELVNLNDGHDPYPLVQVEALAYVMAIVQAECPTVRYIRRHADVAVPHGRKSDPAGLTQSDLYTLIKKYQPALLLK